MELDLRQVEAFCRVVDVGTFTGAAAELGLSQAAVSERVANLEGDVGAPLLDRLGRRVRMTRVGERLYEHGVSLLRAADAARAELQAMLGEGAGRVVVGASTIPGEHILPAVVARFRQENPRVAVEVQIGDTSRIIDQLVSGEVELAVVGSRVERPHLRFTPLWEDELAVVVPCGHAFADRTSVSVADVCREPFVTREPGSGTRTAAEKALGAELPDGFRSLDIAAQLGSTAAVKEAIVHGLGITILSRRAVRLEVQAGLLRTVPLAGITLTRQFLLAEDPRRTRSPACQRFVGLLVVFAAV